jgi:malate permease and related proteins
VIAVAAAIVASVAAGTWLEHRFGARAQAWSRTALTVVLYGVLPPVAFFNVARLHFTVDVFGGIALAWVTLAVVGLLAGVAARRMALARASTGALIVSVIQVNTGYLGIPLCATLLGHGAIGAAVAYDALVTGPALLVGAFGVGAAFGDRVGEGLGERAKAFLTRNPPLLATLAGLVAPAALAPDVLVDASRVLVIALLPVGFTVLGITLAAEAEEGQLRVPPPLTRPVVVALALRLVVAPLLLIALTVPLLDPPDAFFVQAAMPAGLNGLVVAHAYGLDLKLTAAAIAWSTSVVLVVATVAGLAT